MDNVSHTLAGLLLAEAALLIGHGKDATRSERFRAVACAASVAANNFPDLDFLYVPITGGRLGYLLHHRGHTHTLPFAVACALFLLGLGWLVVRSLHLDLQRRDVLALVLLIAVGPLCHLLLDYSNNYGVHPFWPFDDRWYYGDAIFIVEPWFWVIALPALFWLSRSRTAKIVYVVLLFGIGLVAWRTGVVPAAALASLVVATLAIFLLLRGASRKSRVGFAFAASFGVAALFLVCAKDARAMAQQSIARLFQSERVLDIVLTPTPGLPICYSAVALTVESGRYIARTARVSLLPSVLPARNCPEAPVGMSAGVRRNPRNVIEVSESLVWTGEYSAAIGELEGILRVSCAARAFMRFSRAPFWKREGEAFTVGDLRYDRNVGTDFPELPVRAGDACPRHVPPWSPPRADLTALPE